MRKILTYIIIIVLIASAIGYGLNYYSEAANKKKVQKIMDEHSAQIADLEYLSNILTYEAYEAGKKAEASKGKAMELRAQRETLKAPQTTQETVERLHKLGYASERILK